MVNEDHVDIFSVFFFLLLLVIAVCVLLGLFVNHREMLNLDLNIKEKIFSLMSSYGC